jgi:hypothetical protein
MKISNTNTLGAKGRGLPYPVTLNPELYLSRTNGKFNKSTNGTIYVNEWIDPYSGLKATQDTGDYRPELVDDGVKFDGVDDYMDVGDIKEINGATSLSLSLWFNNITIKTQWLFIKKGSNNNMIQAFIYDDLNILRTRFDIDGTEEIHDLSYNDTNKWHNYLVVFESGYLYIYIDNEEKISVNVGSQLDVNGGDYRIGSKDNFVYYFDGFLDENLIYPYALSRSQITNLYNYTKQLKGI